MKAFNIKKISTFLLMLFAAGMAYVVTSCDDDPHKFESTSGKPTIHYLRMPDIELADQVIEGAYMENTICIVGDNLRSVRKIIFNDQEAILNTSFITDHTLFVNIPKELPGDVTDMMYLITKKDTVEYPFTVLIPAPIARSISNEYAFDGQKVTLYGDYFIEEPDFPVKVTMSGNLPVTEILSVDKTEVTFVIPEGAEKGYITVESIHGISRSKFQFRDDRGFILDWDELNANGGWRAGVIRSNDPVKGIKGNYVYFGGDIPGDNSDWNEDDFSFNLWGEQNGRPKGDLFDIPIEEALLKFEINVSEPWAGNALQMIFHPWDFGVDEEGEKIDPNNAYIANKEVPRGLWRPWEETGSFVTDGWITVSFPLKDFIYDHEGNVAKNPLKKGECGSLTFFVYHGGIEGEPSSPKISIDNIRVVPAE